ncbi:MAG: MBOAT family protein [Oscillospiraceae bacterium]|nr:MBOAT family protein [Oscillospiraceae bacterium]
MVFSSTIFLFAFLPVVLLGYYLLDRRFKNIFLLLASLFFYAWGEPRFVFVMMGSILVNHLFALLIDRTRTQEEELGQHSTAAWYRGRARFYLTLTVIFNLALFFVYKYLDFAITNLNAVGSVFKMPELPLQGIALPIGISFFTFQAMSYVFDVYSRRGKVQKNPLNTALYVALFPQLIAGPIVRYEMVANEINTRQETLSDFAEGIRRFILGLAKKVILSNSVAIIADQAFGITDFSELSVAFAWLGAVSYTLQIYFDFSGYSDMAIGLGLMFGFHFNENFDYPYCSKSISEFWRRWHISLGSWFRDYVYIPLGGSRVESKSRHIFNLFVVWLLTGLWHGAAWHYVAWGLFYFVLLVIEKVCHLPERFNGKVALYSYQAFTLLAVVIGWVLFRANGLKAAFGYLCSMLGLAGNTFSDAAAVFLIKQSAVLFGIAILFCTPVVPKFRKAATGVFGMAFRMAGIVLYLLLFLVAVSFTVTSTYNPFIYFNF